MEHNHGHSHGNQHQEQAIATLKDAMNKYDGHDHNNKHHSHDRNHIEKGPEVFDSESLDLESEIKSINSNIENKEILDHQHAHRGNERHGQSHGHHGDIHEEGHEHDEHNNETESSNKLRQNDLHESMFLTLQNGR
jgi:hypothetical protein